MQLCLWGKHHLRSMASWSPEATAELITVWSQENVQNELDGVSRNRTIFERIAKELCEKGYDKSWQQCRTKIKNLTQKYRKAKDTNRVTGETVHSCQIYEEMDSVLGTRAASTPSVLLESSGTSTPENSNIEAHIQDEILGDSNENSPTIDTSIAGAAESLVEGNGSGYIGNESGSEETVLVDTDTDKGASSSRNSNNTIKRKRGLKRKQKDVDSSVELSTALTKFIEVSEECERKRQAFEAKFRERERKHKERMLMMIMGIMQQISCPPSAHHGLSTYLSHSTQSTYPSMPSHSFDFTPSPAALSPYGSPQNTSFDFTPSPCAPSPYGSHPQNT